MADTGDIVKGCAINTEVACTPAFTQAASRLEQAAIGGPGAKIAREVYEKPINDGSLDRAKQALLELPREQIRDASAAFHKLNLGDREQMREIGRMMTANASPDDIENKTNQLKSPELRDGLIALQMRYEQDKQSEDRGAPYKNLQDGIKKLDGDSQIRETAFKGVVNEAAKERMMVEMGQRRPQPLNPQFGD